MNGAEDSGVGRRDPVAVTAVAAAAALAAIALLRSQFLPFVDLPQHLALAELLNKIQDPAVSGYYEVSLVPQVNILGLVILTSLLRVLPETPAVSLVLVLYLAGLAWSLRRLARSLRVSEWNAVVALLFAANFNLWYGFVSFCLGIPIMIFIFARLADPGSRVRPLSVCAEALLWFLLVLAHALLFAFALAASLLWLAVSRRRLRERILRLVAAAPATVWLSAWWASSAVSTGRAGGASLDFEWHGAGVKLAGFGRSMIVAGAKGSYEWIVLGAVGLLVAALVVREVRMSVAAVPRPRAAEKLGERGAGAPQAQTSGKPRARGRRGSTRGGTSLVSRSGNALSPAPGGGELSRMRLWVRLAALTAFLLYCALPYAVTSGRFETRGVFLLYNRFLVLAPMLIVPTLAWPTSASVRHGLALAALALNVALAWHLDGLVREAAAEAEGLDGAVSAMAPGKIVKSLIYTPYPDAIEFPSFMHAASYYQARRTGEVDQSFALLPDTPVHYRDPDRLYLSRHDEHLAPHLFNWDRAELYDYILVYDRGGAWRRFYAGAPYRRIYEKNGWTVFDVKGRGMRRDSR